MEEEPQEIFALYDDKGKRWEFSDSPENAVVVRLEEPFWAAAKRIKCKILRKWK